VLVAELFEVSLRSSYFIAPFRYALHRHVVLCFFYVGVSRISTPLRTVWNTFDALVSQLKQISYDVMAEVTHLDRGAIHILWFRY
jgi:hypothetical protein